MQENKESKNPKDKESKEKKLVDPGEIKGKIEVPDTRERKDGPGGD